jgi:Glycine cleavage T-protein C-terminal barrel domain
MTSMRRQALWRPDLCGLWVRYSSNFSSPLLFLHCILSHSYVPLSFLFSFSVFLGGPASRRRKEQGYLGASHILKPDGGLKVHTSIQFMSYTAHIILPVSSLPIPVISPLLSSLPCHLPIPQPVTRKRVTIVGMKAPARAHTMIHTLDGSEVIGEVTSGGFGPTMGKAVAMG